VYSAADFEDFLEPRPELPARMEPDLGGGAPARQGALALRMHAT